VNVSIPKLTMASTDIQLGGTRRTASRVRTGLLLVVVAGFTALLLVVLQDALVSSETVPVAALGVGFALMLYTALGSSRVRATQTQRMAAVIWWFLLCSQKFFARAEGTSERAFEGRFAGEAYAEGAMWVLAFLALLILITGSVPYIRRAFSGPAKWLSFYALLCLLSAVRAPRPAFSAAWAVKLCIVVLLVQTWSSQMNASEDAGVFLRATFWGFAFLAIEPVLITLFSSTPFEEGRLGGAIAPDGQSELGATFLLLSLTLRSMGRSRAFTVFFGALGVATMILPGGKTAIVVGIVSASLFFMVQKRLGSALGWVAGMLALGVVIVMFTPLSTYFHMYLEAGQLSTLTGRTDLWRHVVPAIWQSPVWGHGFMASRFFALQYTRGAWEPGHTHNAILEVLYNNGLVGLVLVLTLNTILIRNLARLIRYLPPEAVSYKVAAGCLAIYTNIILDGLMNANFGGRVGAPFMVLIALVAISDRFVKLSLPAEVAGAGCLARQADSGVYRRSGTFNGQVVPGQV
jgi:O-antigen ligase